MKLIIDNRDLPFTIDTYGMFTGDSWQEMESEYFPEEYGIKPEDVEFNYDHAGIVKDFAAKSVDTIIDTVIDPNYLDDCGIVQAVGEVIDTGSPKFYNYTTDHYTAEYDIDAEALVKYVQEHSTEFGQFILDEWREIVNVPEVITLEYLRGENEDDKFTVAALAMHLEEFKEDYNMTMWEHEHEIYSENTTYTESMQRAIDAAEKESK